MVFNMSCRITSMPDESLFPSRGQASMDRWEGLKEWHRRHQEILQKRTCDNLVNSNFHGNHQSDSSLASQESLSGLHGIDMKEFGQMSSLRHDLSVISEGDEDLRMKNDDKGINQVSQDIQTLDVVVPSSFKRVGKASDTFSEVSNHHENHANKKQTKVVNENIPEKIQTITKRPFLRRGQGLVRYNLKPEEVMHPYRKDQHKQHFMKNSSCKSSVGKGSAPLSSTFSKPSYVKKNIKPSSPRCLLAPMQRLVLTPCTDNRPLPRLSTWSQVLQTDLSKSANHSTNKPPIDQCKTAVQGNETLPQVKLVDSHSDNAVESGHLNGRSHQDEEQESLAAYIDLEQHIGNASFCSTSSKVDLLVAKSSQSAIHPSNPDTIAQTKAPSPSRTMNTNKIDNGAQKCMVWTEFDVNTMLKSRNWQFGCSENPHQVTSFSAGSQQNNNFPLEFGDPSVRDVTELASKEPAPEMCSTDIAYLMDRIGQGRTPVRKPHLMKTMPSIDLDSSLVRNGLTLSSSDSGRFSKFDAGSDSSSSSTESDSDSTSSSQCSRSKGTLMEINKGVSDPGICNDVSKNKTPLDADTVKGINQQIELHLEELRKEINSLQEAKTKSQKYVSSLEKKVLELEHRLVSETRSFSKRIDEEKLAAEKKISEEQAKFFKEKQALQKTIREQRKNIADPVTQQELMRLKQELAQSEEKCRADRAKARGHESNLRIQITNLKRENEKLREDNNKLRREKEAAVNTARAKVSTNTRVINSIAQQLGKRIVKNSNAQDGNSGKSHHKVSMQKESTSSQHSAYNLSVKPAVKLTPVQSVTTISTFPKPASSPDEWESEDDIDFGKEFSDNEDSLVMESQDIPRVRPEFDLAQKSNNPILDSQEESDLNQDSQIKLTDSIIEETQAKYDALFKADARDISDLVGKFKIPTSPAGSLSHKTHRAPENQLPENFARTVHHPDGRVEQVKESGTRVITYPDGTWERHSSSGSIMTVPSSGWPVHISYFNGDQLEKSEDGTVKYFYAKSNIWQTTFPDGHEELLYPSGQVEHRSKDGSTKFTLSSASLSKDGGTISESSFSHQGICIEKDINGDTLILFPNGERELHTKEYKRKDFLDGTIKFVHKDGSQETRYPSGRIRLKDSKGNLVSDTSSK